MSTKKIALITGANRGIGFETAKQLGEKGVAVIVAVLAVLPALSPVNEAILPVPVAARPMVVSLFVQ